MGTVYRAYDRLTGQIVALKRVLPPTANGYPETPDQSAVVTAAVPHAAPRDLSRISNPRDTAPPFIISMLDYCMDSEVVRQKAG
jgi:hypothetical protein